MATDEHDDVPTEAAPLSEDSSRYKDGRRYYVYEEARGHV